MKEVFLTLGVIALLRHLGLSLGVYFELLIAAGLLTVDFALKKAQMKEQANLEAFKLYVGSNPNRKQD